MTNSQQTYTYRAGKKVLLEKQPYQFVVGVLPEDLRNTGITHAEQVSSATSRVTVRAVVLEPTMGRARSLAPTHHACTVADTGDEFLISDRVFITFRESLPLDQMDAFAGKYGLVKKKASSCKSLNAGRER